MKDIEIIDNYLDETSFSYIKNIMMNNIFPWYTMGLSGVSHRNSNDGMYFTHNFYSDQKSNSDFTKILKPLIDKVSPKSIIRIKGNLYPGTKRRLFHDWHTDYNFLHDGFIFYINTNNGFTILKNGKKIKSIENRILFFNPNEKHRSTTCTDSVCRININCNFLR